MGQLQGVSELRQINTLSVDFDLNSDSYRVS